jgi:hypothetical protein
MNIFHPKRLGQDESKVYYAEREQSTQLTSLPTEVRVFSVFHTKIKILKVENV